MHKYKLVEYDGWSDPEYDAFITGHEPKLGILVMHRVAVNLLIWGAIGALAMLIQSL
jgi:hypothetical protein